MNLHLQEWRSRLVQCLDLTDLQEQGSEQAIQALCEKSQTPFGRVAALCVYMRWIPNIKQQKPDLRVATVVNFPHGDDPLDKVLADTQNALELGADEIDVVLPYKALVSGNSQISMEMLQALRQLVGDKVLKVILETGALPDRFMIQQATKIGLDAGVDFIKTSTGKVPIGATWAAVDAILELIRDPIHQRCGLKISGGVKTLGDALAYGALILGAWGEKCLGPHYFRIGASGLLDQLLADPESQTRITPGQY